MAKFKITKTFLSWVRVGAEYAALILLLFHLLPEQLVEKAKENGLAAIILLGVSLIVSLIFRYLTESELKAEINNEKEISNRLSNEILNQQETNKNLERQAVYGKVFPILNQAFSQLHDTIRTDLTETEFRHAFQDFCTKLASTFDIITSSKCHVCIKIPIVPKKNLSKSSKLKAVTLVRDAIRVKRDGIDSQNIDHWFNSNTDFEHIFLNIQSEKGRYFFSNNLASLHEYKNSSFLSKGENPYFHSKSTVEEREKDWPLSYRSSIASAICPGIAKQRSVGTLFGFLCLDCEDKDRFDENVDPEIIAGCADGLYNPLYTFINKFMINETGKTK